jgi:hypothetical protein
VFRSTTLKSRTVLFITDFSFIFIVAGYNAVMSIDLGSEFMKVAIVKVNMKLN